MDISRTETRIGGPWSRSADVARVPRLPALFAEPIPACDELSAQAMLELMTAAQQDPAIMAQVAASSSHMSALASLVVRMAEALVVQDARFELMRTTTRERMVDSERENLRLRTLHASRCDELDRLRRVTAELVAQTAVRDGVAALAGCRCATERDATPPAMDEYPDTDVIDEYEISRGPVTRMDQAIAMAELMEGTKK